MRMDNPHGAWWRGKVLGALVLGDVVHLIERCLRTLQRIFDVLALGIHPLGPLSFDQWISRAGVKLRADRSRPLDVTGGFLELLDCLFHSFLLLLWRRRHRVLVISYFVNVVSHICHIRRAIWSYENTYGHMAL